MKRGKFVQLAMVVAIGISTVLAFTQAQAAVDFPSDLDAATHPKFMNEMPLPARVDATSGGKFTVEMRDTVQFLGIYDTFADVPTDNPLYTAVWGYGFKGGSVTYPGATFVAMRDVPVDVKWENKLPKGLHLVALDDSIHLVDPIKKTLEEGNIPVVAHLHGGHTESASDGLPEAWFTQGWAEVGPHWVKKEYHYDNDQEAATLWYHDHALGITRLNVYAGLAGFYFLRDSNENALINDNTIPSGDQELEIVIQDRVFDANGQLRLPVATGPEETNFPSPLVPSIPDLAGEPFLGFDFENNNSIVAEFFGDFILVNGVAWPYKNVEPRKYRLRLLNGSDSRFYVLQFRNSQTGTGAAIPFLQIGTDDGLLEYPVQITQLIIAPGERADVVVDFSSDDITGNEVFLRNFGPDEPFKTLADIASNPAEVDSTQQVMKFVVGAEATGDSATVATATNLRPAITPLVSDGNTRKLGLFEGLDEFGRLQPLLGVAETTLDLAGNRVDGSLSWFNPITEWPTLDTVEEWEIYNSTEDAHPIHLHLVTFQIINREPFDTDVIDALQVQHDGTIGVGKILENIQLLGGAEYPAANEDGWKDTVIAPPGHVTRVIARFDRPGRYVWHCHILSHEDHEMMRPFQVVEPPAE
ncbi:MAG: multicopper oxidase [Deltaproteobacteria bacterium]|jgi:spore coat protein A